MTALAPRRSWRPWFAAGFVKPAPVLENFAPRFCIWRASILISKDAMGATLFHHPRLESPSPDRTQKALQELPAPELIEADRSHLLHGLFIASLLAAPFWIAVGIALYLFLR
jgi:hypothetical protein